LGRIHQFPVTAETLLLTFLPYHTEPLYARLLQIISLPPIFSFLEQYTNIRVSATLPPVPRQHFIRALSRDPTFLEKYSTFLVSCVHSGHGFSAQIVTWTTLLVEAILQMRQARTSDEDIVQRIMPFVAQALQMKTSLEFQIAGYTVLTILASNGTLTTKVVDAAMEAVVLGWTEQSRRYGLLCLVTLAQSRDGEVVLTESVVQSLLSLEYVLSLDRLISGTWCHRLKRYLRKRRSGYFLYPSPKGFLL
jgi:U3 small nucleolar RNA-associated protein 10